MTGSELKRTYIEFFKGKGHAEISGKSLIPENDPTVLFTTAGMHPLVPYILGEPHPAGKRLVDVQKCIRTDDIEEVGDPSHLTFFEMLGNWSLGDYFKEDAIRFSYEFLTSSKWLGFSPDVLSVTVFAGDKEVPSDNEAAGVWKAVGIPESRIHFLPRKDNWWGPAGQTGPCGPDTEMFIDTGAPACGPDCRPGCHCGKYFEVWNDVFMQYNKSADGTYPPLAQKTVDTGHGRGPHHRHAPGEEDRLRDGAFLAGDQAAFRAYRKTLRHRDGNGHLVQDHHGPRPGLHVHPGGRQGREAFQPRPGLHPAPPHPAQHPPRPQSSASRAGSSESFPRTSWRSTGIRTPSLRNGPE